MTLKRLESSVEKTLFVRAVRGTGQELTEAGHELAILYEELLRTISKIQSAFPGLARSRD
jgi:DNA-binding transcriptional LysR family regulator